MTSTITSPSGKIENWNGLSDWNDIAESSKEDGWFQFHHSIFSNRNEEAFIINRKLMALIGISSGIKMNGVWKSDENLTKEVVERVMKLGPFE